MLEQGSYMYVGNQSTFNIVIGTWDLSYRVLVYYRQLANIEDFTFPMKGSSSGVPLGSYRKECKTGFCLVFVAQCFVYWYSSLQ